MRLCDRRSAPCFVGFLDEGQRAAAEGMLRGGDVIPLFWGGHPDGERTILGVFPAFLPPTEEQFPLSTAAFLYRKGVSVTHRDVLGSLLAVGIRRETVGDILCADGISVVFLRDEVLPYVSEQVTKIGGEGVQFVCPYTGVLPAAHTFRELHDTVASARLDAVLRICLAASREEAARRIEAGLVQVNHRPCLSVSSQVREGDVLSVRGAGRFRVRQVGPQTRKGRLFITLDQYI